MHLEIKWAKENENFEDFKMKILLKTCYPTFFAQGTLIMIEGVVIGMIDCKSLNCKLSNEQHNVHA